jgi:hypothetical protein
LDFHNHYVTVLDSDDEPYRLKIKIRELPEEEKLLLADNDKGHNFLMTYDLNIYEGIYGSEK